MGLVDKLGLSLKAGEVILETFRLVIPEENNLFESFYKINKSFLTSKIIKFQLCNICQKELNNKKKCPSETCFSNQTLYSFKPIKVFDLLDRLFSILISRIFFLLESGHLYFDRLLQSILRTNTDRFHFEKKSANIHCLYLINI